MALSYPSIKQVIDKVKKLDHSHHYDIFNILRKYDLNFSQNNNGLFFDFDNIKEDVLVELQTYLKQIQQNVDQPNIDDTIEQNEKNKESQDVVQQQPSSSMAANKITKQQLIDECQSIVNELAKDPIHVSSLLSSLDKVTHSASKKTAINQFNIAKKKYGKQVVSDTKYLTSDLLCVDSI